MEVADLPLSQFEALSTAAADIAAQFEKRHRIITSKGWQRWCRTSVIAGSSALIKWAKRPETELPLMQFEAQETKLQRVQQEWQTIWGYTPPVTIGLDKIPTTSSSSATDDSPIRVTSKGVEKLCTRGKRAHK